MADAAPKFDDEIKPGNADSAPPGRPQLKKIEGGGETSPPTGDLHSVPDSTDTLRDREEGTGSPANSWSTNLSQKDNVKRSGFVRGPKNNLKKRVTITVVVAIATIASTIAIFLALLPLKILHVVTNLQDRFYATSENAIQGETDSLFKQYVVQHVLPSYKSCGTTISKNCRIKVTGTNPVTNMYKTWANAKLENKLAVDYGIEFQHKPDGWYMKAPNIASAGINIGETGEKIDSAFKKVDISEIRNAVQNETKWNQVFFRFKVGRLLEEKYGIRRCLIFCSVTDPLASKVADQKIAAKLFLTQRVIVPRNQTLGIALECLLSNCTADKTQPTDATPGVDGAENGAPENPETDTAIRDGLEKLAATYGLTDAEAVNALVETYTEISDKGFQNYLITKALTPVIGETTAGKLSDAIPVAGWIDLVARLVNAANDSSHNLKKLSYVTNASAAVALFAMYRTYADEVKSGKANATEVGSLVDSLGPGNTGASSDPEVGGNVGAEGAPLYNYLINGNANSQNITASSSSLISYLLPNKVLAASTTASSPSSYRCSDGNPIPAGSLVCNEEVLGVGNHYANLVHEFLNISPLDAFTKIAQLWRATVGQVFDLANSIFGSVFQKAAAAAEAACKIPVIGTIITGGYCAAKDLANQYAPQVMNAITQWLIPNPFSSNMGGGRTFDMMAAGADVAGNDSAHTTLGGQELTATQTAAIISQQQEEATQEFSHQSLFARMFSPSNQYSLVSRMAMAMPMNMSDVKSDAASIFLNPLGKLASAFTSVFRVGHVLAAAPIISDPFGVVQYGYPDGSIPSDPEAYWDQNCSDNAAFAYRKDNNWNLDAANGPTDPNTQMPVNIAVNPCLLIKAAAGTDGGIFTPSLLTADDLGQ